VGRGRAEVNRTGPILLVCRGDALPPVKEHAARVCDPAVADYRAGSGLMRLLRRLSPGGCAGSGYIATVGGFDGIHLGHRLLIERARAQAQARDLASMVLTFEPLPKEYFAPDNPPARLTNFRERWRLLEQDGPDVFCALRFNDRLRRMTAADFAQMLVAAGVRGMVIGHDFRAGYRGEASTDWFLREGPALGLSVDVVPPVLADGVRIGSGVVRDALAAGDLQTATRLLGRRYAMRGRVVQGEQLGRKLGYPTANLRLARRQAPMNGIFAVRVRGAGNGQGPDVALGGVASLGTRPTVGGRTPLLEAHLFDFAGDLYGREIEVEFVARLRDELRFDNVDAMVEQMHADAAAARGLLAAG
jgi:riboflavin kinase / FMN adenylyltransferase